MAFLSALLAGAVTGILSGFGVGGGTLLLIYMTAFAGVPQTTAQGINLLYFLPADLKNGYVEKTAALPAIAAGLLGTALAAWLATALDVAVLHRCFGGFLLFIGAAELVRKPRPEGATPGSGGR